MSTALVNRTPIEKVAVRFFFVFFILTLLPLAPDFYTSLFSGERASIVFFTIFSGVNYIPVFMSDSPGLYNLFFIIVVSIALSGYLFLKYPEAKADVFFSQALRIVLRYKLAAVLFTYAFIKIFPQQVPFPTLSEMNTQYGDFTPAKIFELTLGVAKANYQTAIGLTELLAAVLLLWRRTATLGAITAVGILLNVVLAAFAYNTGDQGYSLYLLAIALFLTAYDLPAMFRLMMEKPSKIVAEKLIFQGRTRTLRLVLKSGFVLVMLTYVVASYSNYKNSPYLIPQSDGLKEAYGLYDVREFRLNNQVIPYSKTDPARWQNVVFEKWATLSIKKAVPTPIDFTKHRVADHQDIDRTFESTGTTGRHYYTYRIDSVGNRLYLQNKNRHLRNEEIAFQYSRPDTATIILSGAYSSGDSIHALLKKVDKKYLLIEGRRKPLEL